MFLIKILFIFVIGAVLGPISDLFHVKSLTSGYPFHKYFGLAWWVPLLFGSATVVVAISHVLADKLFKRQPRELSMRQVVMGLWSFMFIYYASGYLMLSQYYKIAALGFIAFSIWYIFDKTLLGLILAFLTAIFGCLIEIMIIQTGHFYYNIKDFFGIPYWLPFLYMTASVVVGNLGRKLFLKPK